MSENADSIRGILPVVHMPYHMDLRIDFDTLRREVDHLFNTGAHGLCLALVSDTLRLTAPERMEMPTRLVEFAQGRGPVIISVGAESTVQARAFARAGTLTYTRTRANTHTHAHAYTSICNRADTHTYSAAANGNPNPSETNTDHITPPPFTRYQW